MADELDNVPRLARWLKNVEAACKLVLEPEGKPVSLAEALILLTPDHPDHEKLFAKVGPLLPENVRKDFEKIRAMRARNQYKELESTHNRLKALEMNPLLQKGNPVADLDEMAEIFARIFQERSKADDDT